MNKRSEENYAMMTRTIEACILETDRMIEATDRRLANCEQITVDIQRDIDILKHRLHQKHHSIVETTSPDVYT